MTEAQKYYECTYVLSPKIGEEAALAYENTLKTLFEKHGATVETTDAPAHQYLGYEIQDSKESFVGAIRFHIVPEKLDELDEDLKQQKEILRFAIIHWKKVELRTVNRVAAPAYTPKKEESTGASEEVIDEQLEKVL